MKSLKLTVLGAVFGPGPPRREYRDDPPGEQPASTTFAPAAWCGRRRSSSDLGVPSRSPHGSAVSVERHRKLHTLSPTAQLPPVVGARIEQFGSADDDARSREKKAVVLVAATAVVVVSRCNED